MYSKILVNGYLTNIRAEFDPRPDNENAFLELQIRCSDKESYAVRHFITDNIGARVKGFPIDIDGIVVCGEGKLNLGLLTNQGLSVRAVDVIFNDPATIVFWSDHTKTVVKCQEGDTYNPETGLAMCYMKKALGNSSRAFNNALKPAVENEEANIDFSDLYDIMQKIRKEK